MVFFEVGDVVEFEYYDSNFDGPEYLATFLVRGPVIETHRRSQMVTVLNPNGRKTLLAEFEVRKLSDQEAMLWRLENA